MPFWPAKTLFDQPFNAFAVFGIEARFGFNKTTWKTYLLDRLKAIFLGALLGGALLAAVLYFFQYSGPGAWLWCWLVTVAFMLLMHYVAPTWIMPLFNRFDPLPEGELRDAIPIMPAVSIFHCKTFLSWTDPYAAPKPMHSLPGSAAIGALCSSIP